MENLTDIAVFVRVVESEGQGYCCHENPEAPPDVEPARGFRVPPGHELRRSARPLEDDEDPGTKGDADPPAACIRATFGLRNRTLVTSPTRRVPLRCVSKSGQ
jgi:hypothetical protein